MRRTPRSRVAIACQGGGSHTAFTAGVLEGLLGDIPEEVEVVALSGTSGGALCAALAWDGLLREEPQRAVRKLESFWESIAATEPWEQVLNQSLINVMSLRDLMVLPEVSPYHLPAWGEEQFRGILNEHFDFPELRKLAARPGAPLLHIGAVEVLTGHFALFTGEELCAECLMASAAIPELFRAVTIPGRGVFWDGLFSQNPPIHDLTDHDIGELWVIQINPSTCAQVPTETHEILDRRNELSGNLSMEQELKFIEMNNRAIAEGRLRQPKYGPIHIARIPLDRDLGYRSKLDRRPEFIRELREYGKTKARWFLQERSSRKHAMRAQGTSTSSASRQPQYRRQ
ncbi:MAG TPA: patatin-like phospholipase family protein [Polyangiaceae bacterium]|nr:patatin-like phospholipase family protein [Polyangiaceae bacterium]